MSLPLAFQVAIAATGTPQNLPANPVVRRITVTAKSTNTASVTIGNVPSVLATTGYVLEKGLSVTFDLHSGDTSALWIVGTSADVISVAGV